MAMQRDSIPRQVVDEHRQLREILEKVRQMLDDRQATQQVVLATLRELIQRILDHFEYEETGGYFDAATEAAPPLRERARELLLEHPDLVERLHALQLCAVRENKLNHCWQELAERFEAFLGKFAAHEAAERALLQEACDDDIGEED